jgi:hypothetical protein
MPVYAGAKQVQKGAWAIPPTEGDYSEFEWRYYEVGDDVSTVANYYRSQMPGKGWTEMASMEVPDMLWSMYSKNNEQDVAAVWVSSDEGKNFLALWRAKK